MEIIEITYRRVRNLGNYESEAVEMTCRVNKSEGWGEAFESLKDCVHESLGLITSPEVDPSEDF